MQGINTRELLENLLIECRECARVFDDNAALLRDENEELSDEQTASIFIVLSEMHLSH